MKHISSLFKVCVCFVLIQLATVRYGYTQETATPIELHSAFSNGYFMPQSPDVWSMIRYGNAGIDYYSGTLGLSIPVYTYSDSDFTIPISIDYASSGYKPGVDCGVVGMGWYLNVGGAITREVRGIPDDSRQEFDWKWQYYLHPIFGEIDHGSDIYRSITVGGYAQFYLENAGSTSLDYVYTGTAGQEYMPIWRETENRGYGYETEPDIFHFNFMGYSGSFILQPNHQVKIFNTNKPIGEFDVDFSMNISEPLSSTKFVITTGDKTKYHFEQRESSIIESSSWKYNESGECTNYSWRLTKIEKPNGAVVQFNYAPGQGLSRARTVSLIIDHLTLTHGLNDVVRVWQAEDAPPVQTITTNASEVSYLTGIDVNGRCHMSFSYSSDDTYGISKLDSIEIYNDTESIPIKTCACTYDFPPENRTVMFLKTVYLSGTGTYKMSYNDESGEYPKQDTYATDWYGYYSGSTSYIPEHLSANLWNIAQQLKSQRKPNLANTQKSTLKQISYPTGGYSTFTYELNTYNAYGIDQLVGGLRIKRIDTFAKSGKQTQYRNFIYEKTDSLSSGVLLQEPGSYFSYSVDIPSVSINRITISTLNNIGFSKDSYIEYLRVLEEKYETPDSPLLSKTEYNYYSASNFHGGNKPTESYSVDFGPIWVQGDDSMWEAEYSNTGSDINDAMFSTNTHTGKKLRSKIEYNSNNQVINREEYVYDEFRRGVEQDIFTTPTLFLGRTGNHEYNTFSVYQSEVSSESYDENANLIYTGKTSFTVNNLGRVNKATQTDSKGDVICDTYSYLEEVPAYPTKNIKTNNGTVISATKYEYKQSGDMDYYVPSKVWKGAITPGLTPANIVYRADCTYDFYDSMGHPWEMTDRNGVMTCYVWGYGGQYLIAKIENMSYDVLSDQYGIAATYSGSLPETAEKMLREIENILVTTYTYKPLVGITSMTDPSGHSTYYEYDNDGKLTTIRDDKGKTLKSYDYHIVTDNR